MESTTERRKSCVNWLKLVVRGYLNSSAIKAARAGSQPASGAGRGEKARPVTPGVHQCAPELRKSGNCCVKRLRWRTFTPRLAPLGPQPRPARHRWRPQDGARGLVMSPHRGHRAKVTKLVPAGKVFC